MKKKTARKPAHKSSRHVTHHRHTSTPRASSWSWSGGQDRSMIVMLAAGTIVLVVIGMYMFGWL